MQGALKIMNCDVTVEEDDVPIPLYLGSNME